MVSNVNDDNDNIYSKKRLEIQKNKIQYKKCGP